MAAKAPARAGTGEQRPLAQQPHLLAERLKQSADAAPRMIPGLPRMKVDDARAAAAGIRKLSGAHLVLYTDMPPSDEIESLPVVFDQAFPQWCAYFNVDPAEHTDWRLTGFLIKERARFEKAGVFPASLPPFRHGYSLNYEFWLYDQPSAYYRRHLLLHEATHCFMNTMFGACGPPWYMEGVAELLATHRWHNGRLTLNYFPNSREEVPMWGRIKIIRDASESRRAMRLRDVVGYSASAHLEPEPYAWCWAACVLLDRHPHYQKRFRQLYRNVLRGDFTARFYERLGPDWPRLAEQWQVFVAEMEYGYDITRTTIDFTPGKPLAEGETRLRVAADRGWQNTGVRLDGHARYRLRATGRYQVADKPRIWWCEPGGVSIRYYRGHPLGILLGAVRADQPPSGPTALVRPFVVGLNATLSPEHSGTLFLKINDSAAELADNAGTLNVEVQRQ